MPVEAIFDKFPEMETERLILRQIHPSDAEAVFAILSDGSVTEFYDDDPFPSVSGSLDQIEVWERIFQRHWGIRWGIGLKSGGGLIGTCGYYSIHSLHKRAGIGYELARAHWTQGMMTEALTAILEFGFEALELNRAEAFVMPENTASIRLLEKLDFINEGLLAKYENWGSKGFVDLYIFALLRPESGL